jgi:hypothetical protein
VVDEQPGWKAGTYNGNLPNSLVYPYRTAVAPRLGFGSAAAQTICVAGRVWHQLHRGPVRHSCHDHGASTALGQRTDQRSERLPVRARRLPTTLQNGFPAPDTIGNYALDPHYHLPYVQVWNLDIQKTMPWNVVVNIGYNGSKGNHLDDTIAPRPSATSRGHRSHRSDLQL